MVTRAKTKAMGVLLTLLLLICLVSGENTTLGELKCRDCRISCTDHGVKLRVPKYINKVEVCCAGSCLADTNIREIEFKIAKEELLVDMHAKLLTLEFWEEN
jgi:hypothetical protein